MSWLIVGIARSGSNAGLSPHESRYQQGSRPLARRRNAQAQNQIAPPA
jgi:hypothetical protein